jgi:carbamoyl-phosphate synthase large subunit
MTDHGMADVIYMEPLVPDIVSKIIAKEKPDGLLPTMGGQTGLNLAAQLGMLGVLEEHGVELLGTPLETIQTAEDRDKFRDLMLGIGEAIPRSRAVSTLEEAVFTARDIGYPVIIRPAYTLGGTGGGMAYNETELRKVVERGLAASIVNQVLVEQSVVGWQEIEYEVMRDANNNCNIVCSMENLDPMGIHTGDSMVLAPVQTLSDPDHQKLRSASIKIIRALNVQGGCNIQFALSKETGDYYVIEVNPRVSRSSALASKATGYPIARISAKIAVGMTLDEIPNRVTRETPASFEPALDYIAAKIPRWPFDKFRTADTQIGTQMKGTGEVMSLARTFEEAIQKAVRSLDIGRFGFGCDPKQEPFTRASKDDIVRELTKPTDQRLFYLHEVLRRGWPIDRIYDLTRIDPWFLHKLRNILDLERSMKRYAGKGRLPPGLLLKAKRGGFSDFQIAHALGLKELDVRRMRKEAGITPSYKMVDTCAAEFEAKTPYYYSTYEPRSDKAILGATSDRRKVVIIGGGPIRIGQGIEFDYCTVHSVMTLREEGYESIVINNNPETVSTDFDISDKLYFEPLTFEDVMNVVDLEKPYGVIVQFGGQTPINLAGRLADAGVNILGTPPESIEKAEDRKMFTRILKKLKIPQARYGTAMDRKGAVRIARRIGFPVLVRPSFVLGGRAMEIVHDKEELGRYIDEAVSVSPEHPILIDRFLDNAIELDVDAVSDGTDVFIGAIMEHIEQAGVHSGDSACVIPPISLKEDVVKRVEEYTKAIALELKTVGLINIQYAVKDETVYVLEANPRASRTIPYVSKSVGVPLAKIATKAMLGHTLKSQGLSGRRSIGHYTVKEAVFPFIKIPGVDPRLAPEMKSTGEVMGIDDDFGLAFFKSQISAGMSLPTSGKVLISVRKDDFPSIPEIANRFHRLGFEILATDGTAEAIWSKFPDIPIKVVRKISEGSTEILEMLWSKQIDLILNTPTKGGSASRDGYKIRRACVEVVIPYITTIAGALASLGAIEKVGSGDVRISSLDSYHRTIDDTAS